MEGGMLKSSLAKRLGDLGEEPLAADLEFREGERQQQDEEREVVLRCFRWNSAWTWGLQDKAMGYSSPTRFAGTQPPLGSKGPLLHKSLPARGLRRSAPH